MSRSSASLLALEAAALAAILLWMLLGYARSAVEPDKIRALVHLVARDTDLSPMLATVRERFLEPLKA